MSRQSSRSQAAERRARVLARSVENYQKPEAIFPARYPGDPFRRRAIRGIERFCGCPLAVIPYLDKSLGDPTKDGGKT